MNFREDDRSDFTSFANTREPGATGGAFDLVSISDTIEVLRSTLTRSRSKGMCLNYATSNFHRVF